jgi:quinol monooxygenase YgiN
MEVFNDLEVNCGEDSSCDYVLQRDNGKKNLRNFCVWENYRNIGAMQLHLVRLALTAAWRA